MAKLHRPLLFAVVMSVGAVLAPGLAAAQAKDVRIAFVNVTRLLAESPQANAANRSLENEFAPRQRDLVAKQNALKTRADKFNKDAAVMGAEERRNAENELRKDERELNRLAEELGQDIKTRRDEALNKLRVDLLTEIDRFARQGGYDLVVSDALFVSPAMDVTAQILQGLQAKAGGPAKP